MVDPASWTNAAAESSIRAENTDCSEYSWSDGIVSGGREQLETNQFEGVTVEVSLTPAQARSGGRLHLQVPIRTPCPSCYGQGHSRYFTCQHCHGAGVLSGEKTVEESDVDLPIVRLESKNWTLFA